MTIATDSVIACPHALPVLSPLLKEKRLNMTEKQLKAERFMAGRGAWMGFFAFLPLLGSAITIVLGLTRANLPISIFSITIGKVLRYVLLVYGLSFIF